MNLLICARRPQWHRSDYYHERRLWARYWSWLFPCLFFSNTCPSCLRERSICLNSWHIRALVRSLLSGQQRQEIFFSPHSAKEAFTVAALFVQRAADHRGNATRLLLCVVFLHGTVTDTKKVIAAALTVSYPVLTSRVDEGFFSYTSRTLFPTHTQRSDNNMLLL